MLKIGDFGLAREYGSPLKQYTEIVVTLWYRAPELLLGCKLYSVPIDVWSAGCVFGELLGQKPLFPGKSEIDQINKIFKELGKPCQSMCELGTFCSVTLIYILFVTRCYIFADKLPLFSRRTRLFHFISLIRTFHVLCTGTPNETIWPGYSQLPATQRVSFAHHPYNSIRNRFAPDRLGSQGFALLNKLLCYDPTRRITAADSVHHAWFSESPLPVDPAMFPTWPAKSEMNADPKKKHKSPTPPSGGGAADKLENFGFKFLNAMQSSSAGAGFSLKFQG